MITQQPQHTLGDLGALHNSDGGGDDEDVDVDDVVDDYYERLDIQTAKQIDRQTNWLTYNNDDDDGQQQLRRRRRPTCKEDSSNGSDGGGDGDDG